MKSYTLELTSQDGASEVEIGLQWRGTRNDLPVELQQASRDEIEEYLMEKYNGREEYAIHEDWYYIMDATTYDEDDNEINVVCVDEPFEFSPAPGMIEYWVKHESTLYGEVEVDKDGVMLQDTLDTDDKQYCVEEAVVFGEGV